MKTVVITIGRNTNTGLGVLCKSEWDLFRSTLHKILTENFSAKMLQYPAYDAAAFQVGEWDGRYEQAATFVCLIEDTTELHYFLSLAAEQFKQECIGCIIVEGDSHLVMARHKQRDVAATADAYRNPGPMMGQSTERYNG